MTRRQIHRAALWMLLAAALGLLAWGIWPVQYQQRSLVYSAPAGAGLPEGVYRIEVDWPAWYRTGELVDGSVQLVQQRPAAALSGAARLDCAGVWYNPRGETRQALSSLSQARFDYRLQADRAGRFAATVWVHRGQVGGAAASQILAAIPLEMRVASLWGLSGPWARALGASGVVIGLMLSGDMWLAIWHRQVTR